MQSFMSSPPSHVRIVHANGRVQELSSPIIASQLVSHTPHFLVCHSASLQLGRRPCPLHPSTLLQLGHLYFVLPLRFFQSRLSWSHLSCLARKASSRHHRKQSRKIGRLPTAPIMFRVSHQNPPLLLVQKGHTLQITTTLQYLERLQEELLLESVPKLASRVNVCHTEELQNRYIDQLIARSNSWRPKLGTIEESTSAEYGAS